MESVPGFSYGLGRRSFEMLCRSLNYPFVSRWRRPSSQLLAGERTIGGYPPFDPFLTASMLWETHLCPVAAIHELLHGRSVHPGGGSHRRPIQTMSGEAWHRYIGSLRLRIASQQPPFQTLPSDVTHALAVIHHDFEEWGQDQLPYAIREESWRELIEPYIRTRLQKGQLSAIVGHVLLPEVTVGSTEVEISLGTGRRTYSIEARVDELNLSLGAAIERTTLPTNLALPSKMVQVAAIAAILRSLPLAAIPQQWAAVRQIRLFLLETPTDTIPVNPTSQELNDAIHDAAAIIRDVAASELAEWSIYQQAQCTPYNTHEVCSHPWVNCFYSSPLYPRSRTSIKRESRALCRAELRDLLWQRDLMKYRLYSLGVSGATYPGVPVEILRIGRDPLRGSFVEARPNSGGLPGIKYGTLILGTPFIGVRHQSRRGEIEEDIQTNTIRVYCDVEGFPLPNAGVLWPAVDEGLLMEEGPYFLTQQRQSDIFALRKIGRSNPQVAEQESIIQILDAVFGGNPPLET
jgi:hypothetical protein